LSLCLFSQTFDQGWWPYSFDDFLESSSKFVDNFQIPILRISL
jgi:hypothetical protein